MKNGEFHHFSEISATCTGTGAEQVRYSAPEPNLYRYRSELYRYILLCFDQCSYFSHNLLIAYPI